METILKIEEVNEKERPNSWSGMEGFKITTDKQEIRVLISDGQSCCESAGYFATNDEIQDFIGSEISDIKLTDTCLNTELMENKFEYGFDDGGIQFVDIVTNKGTLQFAVYNCHNGYYGHSIEIKSNQVNLESSL